MKTFLLLFTFQLFVYSLNAQIYTFNMHDNNKVKYRIDINIKEHKINATQDGEDIFSEYFYDYTIDSLKTKIGMSFEGNLNAVTNPEGYSFFIIARGVGMTIRLTDGYEYLFKCDDSLSNATTYDQLAKTLSLPPSPPPPPPSDNDYRTFTVNGVSFHMVAVHGGTFTMGNVYGEEGDDDYPDHKVTLSSYMIGQTEVTQALWFAVMGSNSSYFIGDSRRPVENVSWDDCQEFIRKLNSLTGQRFRLPTEAEWEFAARGGNKSRGYKYSGSNSIDNVAWYRENAYDVGSSSSNYGTHPVATKSSNELGIYDMSGNVCEWCNDWYGSSYYGSSPSNNPQGPSSDSFRVMRGGSWFDYAECCRLSSRSFNDPGDRGIINGLRLSL